MLMQGYLLVGEVRDLPGCVAYVLPVSDRTGKIYEIFYDTTTSSV